MKIQLESEKRLTSDSPWKAFARKAVSEITAYDVFFDIDVEIEVFLASKNKEPEFNHQFESNGIS